MPKRNTLIIGCGKMVQNVHLKAFARHPATHLAAIIEPSPATRKQALERIRELGMPEPAAFADTDSFRKADLEVQSAFIATPHKFHCRNILECLDLGLDVLVEKPMVLNADEAREVIARRDQTGKTVVVGFQGGLSPDVQRARRLIQEGEIGELISVCGTVHQNWADLARDTWRMQPEISGGGFLFDTGSHLINTMVHVVGSDVDTLEGTLDYCGFDVEINAVLSGRFKSGVLYAVSMSGNSYACDGYLDLVGSKGIIRLGMWGHVFKLTHDRIHLPMTDLEPEEPATTWEVFNAILDGNLENTSPPEVGLRFAHFMDKVRMNCSRIN